MVIMSTQDILNCSFPLWYSNFMQNTTESVVLKIPQVFIDYLLADGVVLPDDDHHDDSQIHEESQQQTLSSAHDNDETCKTFSNEDFVEFRSQVVSAIQELGGKIFPKLNWSSPKDASWIAINGSLCCENFNDICLLLKSSEFITHDLTDPFSMFEHHVNCDSTERLTVNYVLVLRKWLDVCSAGEYRCFVRNRKLIAISQRSTQHFSFIDSDKNMIVRNINRFYKSCVKGKFPNSCYTMDLYIPGDNKQPVIVDFNPFVTITDGLLFSWDELEEKKPMLEVEEGSTIKGIVFRSVPVEGVTATPTRNYAFPLDFQHLATGEDPAKLIDLLKLQQRASSSPSIDSMDSD